MATASLQGLRVIITRPKAQVLAWQACLQQAGAESISVPLLAIEPVTEVAEIQAVKNIILDFDHYACAIFVSQNAVFYGCEWIDQYWPQQPLGVDFLAVGKTTAAKLALQGYSVSAAGQAMNSEALLALPELADVEGKKIVIFRGSGGRPYLSDQLTARGASVDYCELYHRRLPAAAQQQLAALEPTSGDVFSVHSGETLENLSQIITALNNAEWLQRPILVPGLRVAGLATDAGFKQVIEAENATDDAMLFALRQWAVVNKRNNNQL